ncbi:DUF3298 and DUF4163 domain-containing protein [Neobacillus vireti]|uniref:DUF3298 and DUF4163 domain-containing protein n=1 Tax=Neobacillus vireti TaxID=220686 RepID=UPI002FFD7850
MNKKILSLLIIFGLLFCTLVLYIITFVFMDHSENNSGSGVTPIVNETPQPTPNVDAPIVPSEFDSRCENQSLSIEIINVKYQNTLDYPQVSNMPLSCKSAEEKINGALEKHIAASYQNYLHLEEEEKAARKFYEEQFGIPVPEEEDYIYSYEYTTQHEVKYQENNVLSLLIFDHIYAGGAHGATIVSSYNFDVSTGRQILLEDVAKTSVNLDKIRQYVIAELTERPEVFQDSLVDVKIDNSRSFYFTETGIVIKFLEAEIAPYAAGMPEVEVPNKVFQ